MDDTPHHTAARLPLAAAVEQIEPPRQEELKRLWTPAVVSELGGMASADGSVRATAVRRWNDLARLADGELLPESLAGDGNRDRREELYAAAAGLARPEHADLRHALTPILQHRAHEIKLKLHPGGGGGHINREAVRDSNVMGYVFVLRQMHQTDLEQNARKLRARYPRADETQIEDAVESAFNAIALNPAADLTRRNGGLLYTAMRNRIIDQFRSARRHSAVHLDSPEGQGLALSLATPAPDPADQLAGREGAATLKQIATRLPEKERDAVMTLIESDGEVGPTELARRGGIPGGTARSRLHSARTHFRERAETDPETQETMRAFARRENQRRHPKGHEPPIAKA